LIEPNTGARRRSLGNAGRLRPARAGSSATAVSRGAKRPLTSPSSVGCIRAA